MIPDNVKEFLSHPGTGTVASRDAQLQPNQIRAFGAVVHPNRTTITCYIAELRSEAMIANFENNGRVAYTQASPLENDSFQLKGKYISWRPNSEEDDQFLEARQSQLREGMTQMGMPEEMIAHWNLWVCKPGVAITFDVETIFGQAPHPETGKIIS